MDADSYKVLSILTVGNDADHQVILQLALGLDPLMTVTCSWSLKEAMDLLSEVRDFDAILMDGDFSASADVAVIAAVVGLHDSPAVIICLTAGTQVSDHARIMTAGAFTVIGKPFDPIIFACLVRRAIVAGKGKNSAGAKL